jgi:hypothetical protein
VPGQKIFTPILKAKSISAKIKKLGEIQSVKEQKAKVVKEIKAVF